MPNISVVSGQFQTLNYNSDQPNMITLDTSSTGLNTTYQILSEALAKVKNFAAAMDVTLTEASAASTSTASSASATPNG